MVVEVFAWPPVKTKAQSLSQTRPVSVSRGFLGTPHYSQAQPARRSWSANVIAVREHGHGYIETLKELLDGKPPFVRVQPLPRHWRRARSGGVIGAQSLEWTSGGVGLNWTSGGVDLNLTTGSAVTAMAGTDTWPYIDCTGLPSSSLVAVPGELVEIGGARARVLRPATSDSDGNAKIYLATALASGSALIGVRESIAMAITEFPGTMQTLGSYGYQFQMVEVFETEFSGGFTEVDPWT